MDESKYRYAEDTIGRPDYFELFQYKRVPIGSAINKVELTRRLAYELQIPQRYGERIVNAFNRVIEDALIHGEGVIFSECFTLTLQRHKKDTKRLPTGVIAELSNIFRVVAKPHKYMVKHLQNLSSKIKKSAQ